MKYYLVFVLFGLATATKPSENPGSDALPKKPQHAALIASPSSTPVLVLKKDASRPVLTSAQKVPPPKPSPPPKPHSVEYSDEEPLSSSHSAERRMFFENMAEKEDRSERLTRSNPGYGASGPPPQFQYPPAQGNYIAHGPTRVPVKYQQGIIPIKPHHQKPQGNARPYKQRVEQAQRQAGPQEEMTSEELEELEEEAQPDRLTELLATSKFACGGKKDGYYADDTLNCEVFHYCQDGGKHSWLCPNGFAFHQIHLICVPPSSDNICKQSSNFHFVNDYLYRPINEKQAASHNESLKYADRYFPDGYNHGAGDVVLPYDDDEEEEEEQQQRPHHRPQGQQSHHHGQSHHGQQAHHPQPHHHQGHHPQSHHQGHHPQPHHGHHSQQQQRSPHPNAYNSYAPTVQQRPTPQSGFQPSAAPQRASHQQQRQASSSNHNQMIIPQQPITKASKPTNPDRSVFYSPETINIPLNQRRPVPPTAFRPSTQVDRSSKHEYSGEF